MHFTTFIAALFVTTVATTGALAGCVGGFVLLSNEQSPFRIATKMDAVLIPLGAVQ